MDYAKLHEEIVVILRSDRLRRIRDAHGSMTALGFTRHDDVWSLDRKGHVPPWQHASIIELDFLIGQRHFRRFLHYKRCF